MKKLLLSFTFALASLIGYAQQFKVDTFPDGYQIRTISHEWGVPRDSSGIKFWQDFMIFPVHGDTVFISTDGNINHVKWLGINWTHLEPGLETNFRPKANAGMDLNITGTMIRVTGIGTDMDGVITSYLWRQLSGPTQAYNPTPTSATTTFTLWTKGEYRFRFTVVDDHNYEASDTLTIRSY
jgi:hypothetical protein